MNHSLGRCLLLCVLYIGTGAKAECNKVEIVGKSQELLVKKELSNPPGAKNSKLWSETITGKLIDVTLDPIGDGLGLYTLIVLRAGSASILCTSIGALQNKTIYEIDNFGDSVEIRVIGGPGINFKLSISASGRPYIDAKRPEVPDKVWVNVDVFVFDAAPLAKAAKAHLDAAADIWRTAGIILTYRIRTLDKAKTVEILGVEAKIVTYLGCTQRFDEPGFAQRERLKKMKSNSNAIGVFIAQNTTQSQAEVELTQVYLSNDIADAPLGRTLAHEIGHLLLGEGHVGGERRKGPCDRSAAEEFVQAKEKAPWTSGLMEAGNKSTSREITEADAKTARKTAIALPGATWR